MDGLYALIPAGIGLAYLVLIAWAFSLFVRLVRAVEKIAQKMPSATAADPADAGHLEQIAERLDTGLHASSSNLD